jgi:hypothetical protein
MKPVELSSHTMKNSIVLHTNKSYIKYRSNYAISDSHLCSYLSHEIKWHLTWGATLLVSGCCYNKPLLVPGGRAFVWPTIQCVQR